MPSIKGLRYIAAPCAMILMLALNACTDAKTNSAVASAAAGQAEQRVGQTDSSSLVISQNASAAEVSAYIAKVTKNDAVLGLDDSQQGNLSAVGAALVGAASQPAPAYTQDQLTQAFNLIRETRFETDTDQNLRRISWLYPDDGCFTRAAVAGDLIVKRLGLTAPAHVFSFGSRLATPDDDGKSFADDLTVLTANSSAGQVSWWYHVAPVVKVGNDLFVLDAAVHPDGPLLLAAWLDAQRAAGGNVGASVICDANAYVPGSQCVGDSDHAQEALQMQQGVYLADEWNRLIELGRNAKDTLLGDRFQK